MSNDISGGYDAHVEIAKAAIRAYVEKGDVITVTGEGLRFPDGRQCRAPDIDAAPLLAERAGAFVSIKKLGALRGCIGTISPVQDNLAEEIVNNAISACSRDPRFDPVRREELADLNVSVDVLSEAEPVNSLSELDVIRYGVIVSKGYRRGLLLPNLEGVDSVEEQISIALSKAGINPSEGYSVERFEVVRHELRGSMRDCC